MRASALALLALACVVPLAEGHPLQTRGQAGTNADEATELVNSLLGSVMGGGDVTSAQLQREVAEVGGIPFQRDVPIAFMGHDELVDYLHELLDSEYPPALAEADGQLLEAFDLLAPGTDLRALRTRLLEDNVVGFYDERPGRQQLFAVSEHEAFTPMNQIVLAHELRHALQDQYQPLHWQLPEDVGDFDDRRLAWMSLLEGDATLLMERFVLARLAALGLGGVEGLALGAGSGEYSEAAMASPERRPRGPPGDQGPPRHALPRRARPGPGHRGPRRRRGDAGGLAAAAGLDRAGAPPREVLLAGAAPGGDAAEKSRRGAPAFRRGSSGSCCCAPSSRSPRRPRPRRAGVAMPGGCGT